MAARATRFLTETEGLVLTALIAAECVFVLGSYYGFARERVADGVASAITLPYVEVEDEPALLRGLELYRTGLVDFPEGYLAALGERTGVDWIASFDRALDRVPSIRRLEP